MHSLAWVIVPFLLQSLIRSSLCAEFQTTTHLFPHPPPAPLMTSAFLQQSDMWLPFLVLCSRSCTQPLVYGVNSLSRGFPIVIQKMDQGHLIYISEYIYTYTFSPSYGFLTIGPGLKPPTQDSTLSLPSGLIISNTNSHYLLFFFIFEAGFHIAQLGLDVVM